MYSDPPSSGYCSNKMPRPLQDKALSAVVPCYNEELGLAELVRRLAAACEACVGDDFEIVLVNDGSSDATWMEILRISKKISQITGVDLARNYGHQLALTAGLFVARGERIFIIDADLQDPPELLSEMMLCLDAGADVAYGQRIHREGETWLKKASAAIFYRLLHRLTETAIPIDTGDFRLMKRRVVDVLLSMPEQHRFVRGMVAWIGFQQIGIPYRRHARLAGRSKYDLRRMTKFAIDAITGFSVAPLRLSFYVGLGSVLAAILLGLFAIWSWLATDVAPGWTSTAMIILAFGAMQMFCLAIMGEYLGRIYIQTKQRPLFVISAIHQVTATEMTTATTVDTTDQPIH